MNPRIALGLVRQVTRRTQPQNATACIIRETLTGIALNSNDLTGISNSKKAIKPSVNNLRFTITSSDVSWWYVTHTSPTTFNPKGKKTTAQGATETGYSWVSTKPASYPVSKFSTEGEHKLYVWVADVNKNVKLSSTSSDPFTVDKTAPTGLSLSSKPSAEDPPGTTTASFTFSAVDTTGITYYYCTGSVTCNPTAQVTGNSLSLSPLSSNAYTLKYKAVDELGRSTSVADFNWKILLCAKSSVETRSSSTTPAFNHGTQTRTCAADGMSWGPLSVATCDGGYYEDGGACVAVGDTYVSAVGTKTRTQCIGQEIPNAGSTSCVGCSGSTHTEDNIQCVANTRTCPANGAYPIPNQASSAEHTWASGSWGSCEATACNTGFKKASGACNKPGKGKYVDNNWTRSQVVPPLPMGNSRPTPLAWIVIPVPLLVMQVTSKWAELVKNQVWANMFITTETKSLAPPLPMDNSRPTPLAWIVTPARLIVIQALRR